jgi:hypothetical protein
MTQYRLLAVWAYQDRLMIVMFLSSSPPLQLYTIASLLAGLGSAVRVPQSLALPSCAERTGGRRPNRIEKCVTQSGRPRGVWSPADSRIDNEPTQPGIKHQKKRTPGGRLLYSRLEETCVEAGNPVDEQQMKRSLSASISTPHG